MTRGNDLANGSWVSLRLHDEDASIRVVIPPRPLSERQLYEIRDELNNLRLAQADLAAQREAAA